MEPTFDFEGREPTEERLQRAQEELLEKWERREGEEGSHWKKVLWFLPLLALFFLLLWNLSLQHQIRQDRVSPPTLKGKEFQKGKQQPPTPPPLFGERVAVGEKGKGEKGTGEKGEGGEGRGEPVKGEVFTPQLLPLPFYEPPRKASPSPPYPLEVPREQPKSFSPPSLPSPPPSPPIEPLRQQEEQIQLVGIVIGEGGKVAVLRLPNGRTFPVGEGERVPMTNWLLLRIEPEGVTLSLKDEPKKQLVLRTGF